MHNILIINIDKFLQRGRVLRFPARQAIKNSAGRPELCRLSRLCFWVPAGSAGEVGGRGHFGGDAVGGEVADAAGVGVADGAVCLEGAGCALQRN